MSIKIAEKFASIQGEGIQIGVPSLFIRFSGCNLRCAWCDTPYASWEPEGENYTLDELLEWVKEYPAINEVVITGGEPFIFPALPTLVQRLKRIQKTVSIETSGTVYQKTDADLITISPKLLNSRPNPQRFPEWTKRHEASRINPSVLYKFVEQSRAVQLKFVLDSEEQLVEVQDILGQLPMVSRDRVIFMPQCRNREELEEKTPWMMDFCLAHGYRFSDRLHIRRWDGQRGT